MVVWGGGGGDGLDPTFWYPTPPPPHPHPPPKSTPGLYPLCLMQSRMRLVDNQFIMQEVFDSALGRRGDHPHSPFLIIGRSFLHKFMVRHSFTHAYDSQPRLTYEESWGLTTRLNQSFHRSRKIMFFTKTASNWLGSQSHNRLSNSLTLRCCTFQTYRRLDRPIEWWQSLLSLISHSG